MHPSYQLSFLKSGTFVTSLLDLSVERPKPIPNINVMTPAKYGRNSDIFRWINQFKENGKCHDTWNP
jgi:hypothetical protein